MPSRARASAPRPAVSGARKSPARRPRLASAEEASAVYARLREAHPDAHCELAHRSPFELLVATVLSAQTMDKLVNRITPDLFARFPDAPSLAAAEPADVAELLRSRGMGMYRQKAKNVVGLARQLVLRHGGLVPRTLPELVALPGVGRKTANVVLGVAFGAPEGVVVDTHVQRLAQRLGWTRSDKPEPIERDLCALFPRADWDMIAHTLIFHGRRICDAQRPACAACPVSDACPSAFRAERVGRKPARARPGRSAAKEAAPPSKKSASKKQTSKEPIASEARRPAGEKRRSEAAPATRAGAEAASQRKTRKTARASSPKTMSPLARPSRTARGAETAGAGAGRRRGGSGG